MDYLLGMWVCAVVVVVVSVCGYLTRLKCVLICRQSAGTNLCRRILNKDVDLEAWLVDDEPAAETALTLDSGRTGNFIAAPAR